MAANDVATKEEARKNLGKTLASDENLATWVAAGVRFVVGLIFNGRRDLAAEMLRWVADVIVADTPEKVEAVLLASEEMDKKMDDALGGNEDEASRNNSAEPDAPWN